MRTIEAIKTKSFNVVIFSKIFVKMIYCYLSICIDVYFVKPTRGVGWVGVGYKVAQLLFVLYYCSQKKIQ